MFAAQPVTAQMFGTHVLRLTRSPATPWPAISPATLRIWDTGTTWAKLEPSRGVFRFDQLDRQVAMARSHHARVLLTLGETPTWASLRPDENSSYGAGATAPPADLDVWRSYVQAVAERYRGRIESYEVWNEPVESTYYTGTPEQLADLTRVTKEVLQAVDPTALVVAPAPYWGADTKQFLERYLKAGGGRYADVMGIHLYTRTPEMLAPIMVQMRQLMQATGMGDKPIWDTETGYGNRVAHPYSSEEARGIVARSYLLASGNGISRFYWYAWDDRKWVKLYMVEPDLVTPTPAAHALEDVERLLIGATNVGCWSDASGVWSCRLHRASGDSLVMWQPMRPVVVPAPADAVSVSALDGTTLPGRELRLGVEPVIVGLRTS